MRPRTLDEYIGQSHILGPGKLLRRAVEADRFHSLIFYGPPGVGKTSLAQLISHQTNTRFVNLSGVESNVSEIRKAVEVAGQYQKIQDRATTLFVDEIHRFNKAQQ
ncbi:MAG: AAA family ATPase, partial [Verrucomicrobiota bacterium]